ncbi:MAG: diaminopimelate epimerase [Chloroflexota bacterium]
MKFAKYHGLGNDYLVVEPGEVGGQLQPEHIRWLCDRHYGAGSDGILYGPLPTRKADFGLRIFNPDGSEAEKSGNGLRIFSRYLWDSGRLERQGQDSALFSIHTPGGIVQSQVLSNGQRVTIEMGQASFDSQRIPVTGPAREVLDERMQIDGEALRYCAVTMGNPHCVVLCEQVSAELAHRLGPQIETEPRFPRRTNVQFLQVLDRENLRIEIWERGAGYTLASGSSSCAAAAAAHRLGLCEAHVTMHMPGGQLDIRIHPDFNITMTGPVAKVYEGFCELPPC